MRGGEDDDGVDVEAFMRKRRYVFVLGVMSCAAAIAFIGAVAAATRDDSRRTLFGIEAPSAKVAIGPIEWPKASASAPKRPKKQPQPVLPAVYRQRHSR